MALLLVTAFVAEILSVTVLVGRSAKEGYSFDLGNCARSVLPLHNYNTAHDYQFLHFDLRPAVFLKILVE